ncbi:hypothetical protein OXYTRIMIC_404 [Oxytricha trifallax]|uniref:Uncharacterized protein n=1 Tax=Oxytricha trifallax TaxID=1172189 RepID=A0A073HWY3_9SPIT|nr:hypothetical protein OXYTRIMIC_404 [Oxytricha trifallax]
MSPPGKKRKHIREKLAFNNRVNKRVQNIFQNKFKAAQIPQKPSQTINIENISLNVIFQQVQGGVAQNLVGNVINGRVAVSTGNVGNHNQAQTPKHNMPLRSSAKHAGVTINQRAGAPEENKVQALEENKGHLSFSALNTRITKRMLNFQLQILQNPKRGPIKEQRKYMKEVGSIFAQKLLDDFQKY